MRKYSFIGHYHCLDLPPSGGHSVYNLVFKSCRSVRHTNGISLLNVWLNMAASAQARSLPVSSVRRPLARTVSEKIAEGQRLKDEGLRLLKEDEGKKAAVKFKTCFAYTKGLLPKQSQLAQYATLTGQQIIIDSEQQVAVEALELACNEGLATVYFRRAKSGDHIKALGYSEKVKHPFIWVNSLRNGVNFNAAYVRLPGWHR